MLPTSVGSSLKYHLDVMRYTSAEMFRLGVEDARYGDSDRKDLLSVLGEAFLVT